MTVINASAAVTLLEQRPEKIQALSGIRTHDLCDASALNFIVLVYDCNCCDWLKRFHRKETTFQNRV